MSNVKSILIVIESVMAVAKIILKVVEALSNKKTVSNCCFSPLT